MTFNLYLSDDYLKEKMKESEFYVYEKNGKIIAMGILEDCCIKKVFIHPKFQGIGIGSEIMNKLESVGIKRGCSIFYGYCFQNSISFCDKNGYEEIKKVYFVKDDLELSATLVEKHL